MDFRYKEIEAKKAALKATIVKFLKTQCPFKRCSREELWNNLSRFTKKKISRKVYGVSKMSNLLAEFDDVLYCDEHCVSLRSDVNIAQNRPVSIVVSSDPEDSEEDGVTTSTGSTSRGSEMQQASRRNRTPWGAGVTSAQKGETSEEKFEVVLSSEDEQENQTKSAAAPSTSGFIPFSGYTQSRENQGVYSQQRYGLPQQPPPMVPSMNTPQGSAQFKNSQLSMQAMAQNFISNFSASPVRPQHPTMPGNIGGNGPVPLMGLMAPVPGPPHIHHLQQQQLHQLQQHQQQQQQQQLQQLQQHHLGTLPAFAGTMAPPPQPEISEWPQAQRRTGPPPGTKITELPPEVVVRPIRLQPGARLTIESVDCEIKACREVLSDAGEHVSMERVHALLLKKFQVQDFRKLNLKERYFDNLPAARDLSMAMGKVNSYIQNFVRSRSMCTLYELAECCREFHPDKQSFEHLQLGPLQKMPLVYELFKFPQDEYIPEITSIDLMEHLNQYLTKYQKWTCQNKIGDFMKYLCEEAYKVESGFSLGVRLRSLPLAIQTLKKAQRDAASTRRHIMDNLKEVLNKDVNQAFAQFRASLLQKTETGDHELRLHYLNLTPEKAIRELFTKFELLAHIFLSDAMMHRKVERMQKAFQNFVATVLEVPIPRTLFHLSVCLSNLEVHESAAEFMEQESARQQQQEEARQAALQQRDQEKKRVPPTKAKLVDKIYAYLNKYLESGHLQLSYLQKIEAKLLDELQFEAFSEMGYGRFLELMLREPKLNALLEECGGTMLGSSSKGHHTESMYKPSLPEVQELLSQANHTGLIQPQQMEGVLCEQYCVADIKHLGHGSNIMRLWRAAQTSQKHTSKDQNVFYEAAVCGKLGRATRPQGQVGILGSQSREAAEACLTMCPLLEDMAAWSQWGLVFQPQLGPLREFIEKYGGQRVITLKGKHGTMATSDFMALEVAPGKLLKICTFSGPEQFVAALEAEDPKLAAGHLVSLIVSNKGVEGAPLALLANHVKTKLLSLHAQSSAFSTPGGPPLQESQKHIDFAVQFVTKMLLAIPLRMCIAIAEQVLLKPLSEVVGSDKSKAQVLLACQSQTQDIQQLEQLGCLLGITEWWSSSLQLKMEFPADYCVTENPQGEDLFGPSLENEEEEDDKELESEDSDDESDIDDPILSGEENGAETENAEENNEKPEEAESLDIATALNDRNNSSLLRSEDKGEKSDSDKAIVDEEKSHDDAGEKENDDEDHDDAEADNADDALEEESYKTQEGSEDENVDKVGEAMEKILAVSTEKKEMTREEICHNIVDVIRREEFGVGIELGEAGQKLMKKQQERQGRSLQRLSKDLYSKDTHFVLELIQNADDNSYPQEVVPAVKFVIDGSGVKVMNNELGFEAKNIQALCDVGKSTKTKHTIGYIGQKGIGFKSVFRVTGRPEVHSNGFHICFDVDSGPMGYILPHWIEAPETSDEALSEVKSWQTLISLPWTEEIKQQLHTHAARFNDIKPSLLLFLHRLKKITIDNRVDGLTTSMLREDLGDGEIHISHSGVKDRWLVVRKILDASKVSIQMKAGVEVDSTEIALAFPLRGKKVQQVQIKPPMLPVFAFLPLRTYGFRFIIQGDFDVPSSREDVDKDSSWNQWLQSEIHTLFIEALEAFQKRPDLSPVDALIQYLQFIPLEGEVVDFFKPVTTRILAQLKASKCLPVLSPEKKGVSWKLPSQCVLVRDTLVREMVSPELLKHRLGLYYLHPEVSAVLDQPLADVLRVQHISTSHLLDIGGFISQNWDGQGNPEQVTEIAKWLACVYRSLDDFQENTHIMEELNKLRVIPLADGTLVAPNDATIFLLTESTGAKSKQNANKTAGKRDPLKELQKDLSLIHTALTNTPDAEINSQVVKLLMQTGAVKQLTAHDLVHCHIMEVFHSDLWREKSREVIISYLIYIKSELEKQPSLIDLSELKAAVQLATNHGIHSPEESSVYFTTAFGNKIDLPNTFPGVKWTLVDAAYLPPNPTVVEKQSWHNFLASLGVVDFLRVRPVEVQFDKETIHETPWAIYKDIWPDTPDGYTVLDYECKEFLELVSVTIAAAQQDGTLDCVKLQQVVSLFERLDSLWESQYSKFTPTQLRSGSGHILKEVIETSFAIHLKTLEWIPAEWTEVKPDKDGMHAMITKKQELCQSCDLFVDYPRVRKRLAHTVKYLKVAPQRNSSLINFLGIRDNVSPEETTEKFLSWCKRHPNKPNTPAIFCTTRRHIFDMYQMFNDELSGKGAQDVFHNNPAIFIPVLGLDDQGWHTDHVVVGKMMAREEVWWHDPLRLFFKYRESLKNFDSPLGNRSLLAQFYHGKNLEDIFQRLVRPEWEPSTLHLAQLLIHVATATTLFEEGTLLDCLLLFSSIGKQLAKSDEKVAGVASSEAIIAQRELQPVVSLLQDAAVFPSQRLEWVNPAHQLLMLPDSAELEKLFRNKPGVYFLLTDLPQNSGRLSSAKNCHLDKEAIQHFVSLFDRIKPISECVRAEEITTGFQQCIPGQTYLHKVIGLIQRFLYFVFPDVYREVKPGRAEALKQLMFVEVNKLEVRYELEDNPEIFEIRGEKCMIKDKMFYFHRAFTSSQNEINSEVAKHFSCGNKACIRELTSFLNQAGLILEAKSYDSMEDLLSRQAVEIGDLPADEEIWEIPLPIIQLQEEPEPEPQPDEPQMVYGKALDFAQGSKECTKTESGDDGQEQGLKSWPPRSSLTVDMDRAGAKKDSEKTGAPAGMWPPPRPPDSGRSTRALPSNIRVEREVSQEDGETQSVETTEQRTAENVHKARENDGRGHISRQSSSKLGAGQSGGATHHRDGSLESQRKSSKGTREWSDGEERRDGSTGRQSRGHHEPSSNEDQSFGEKQSSNSCKRKASDSSREGEPAMTKRFNSQTDEISEMDKKHRPRDGGTMEGRPSARGQEFEERGNEPDRVQDNDLSHRDTSASSSGTSQDSPTKSRRDKRRMHFTVPMWSAINQDLEYTDLTEEISANLPNLHLEDLEQNDQAEQNLAVGRWGEMLVLDYLHKLKNSNPNIDAVLWANAEGEKGLPWDFEVIYTEGDNTQLTVYIEVKTTITADREMFEVSPRQLELALKEGRNFQVYRVFGAGKPEPRLLRIENVADKMNKKQIKLFMIV